MKLIYVAGPYRASTPWKVDQNIQRAREAGAKVAELGVGAFPVVPHANTSHFEGLRDDAYFLAGTLELLRRCDAMLLLPDSDTSEGAQAELLEARKRGLMIFTGPLDWSLRQLADWLRLFGPEMRGKIWTSE